MNATEERSSSLSEPRAPVGTVTLLFGEVEGLTGSDGSDPEAQRLVRVRLERLLAWLGPVNGGYVVPAGDEPDAASRFAIAFDRAAGALRCALDLQQAAAAERWPGGVDVRLRIGVHTGDADLGPGGTYTGPAVEQGVRLRDLGYGGQTLVSATTRDVVGDNLDEGPWLEDLGPHRLGDLSRTRRIHQLCHPDLHNTFPPLRSLDALPNNLPIPSTSFVGRAEELSELSRAIAETRLLTLTGSGGCGKTRLALHLAADTLVRFVDGGWWVDLAPVADPALVAQAITSVIGLRRHPGEDAADVLERGLCSRQVLLVLDNCEHVITAVAELVTRLLGACPDVTVVATSREPLGVYGEVSRRVPSLPIPPDDVGSLAELEAYPASRLFLDRAAATAAFVPDSAHAPPIARICRALDGIPLAIELAAARTRTLTVAEIARGLSDRFALLANDGRSGLARQRTLQASMAWSYDLLSPDERTVLARLSLFAGSFDPEAAQAVACGGAVAEDDVPRLLTALVNRSLVLVTHTPDGVRYHLLETVRDYALERLAELGETDAVRHRHLDHFTAVAVAAGQQLRTPRFNEQAAALDRILDDLRSATRWAVRSGRIADLVTITRAVLVYWMARSLYDEIGEAMAGALTAEDLPPHVEADALALGAFMSAMGGEYATALDLGRRAEVLARQLGDDQLLFEALLPTSWASVLAARGGQAEAEEALAIAERLDSEDAKYRALLHRSFPVSAQGSPREAEPLLEEAVTLAERAGDPYNLSIVRFYAAVLATHVGDWGRASVHAERALAYGRSIDHAPLVCLTLVAVLGYIALLEGRYDDADEYLSEGRALVGEPDSQFRDMAVGYGGLLDLAMGRHEQVEHALAPTVERWRSRAGAWWIAYAQTLRAASARARGDLTLARTCIDEALELPLAGGTIWTDVQARRAAAALARSAGDAEAAENLAHEALAAAHEAGLVPSVVDLLELLGGLAADLGTPATGIRALGAAERAREDLGYVRFPNDRRGVATDLDALRAQLPTEEFDRVWSEGHDLDWSDACHYLRRGRGQRGRPTLGWDSLTPTEIEVVRHTATGLSNPEIADAMFVSRNTIKTHLSHIYTKLGVGGRTELTAEALRRGVVG